MNIFHGYGCCFAVLERACFINDINPKYSSHFSWNGWNVVSSTTGVVSQQKDNIFDQLLIVPERKQVGQVRIAGMEPRLLAIRWTRLSEKRTSNEDNKNPRPD